MALRTLVVAMLLSWACYSFDVPRAPCYGRAATRHARPRSRVGLQTLQAAPSRARRELDLATMEVVDVASAATASAAWTLTSSALLVFFSGRFSACRFPASSRATRAAGL